jgi:hypothetical protein
MKYTIELTAEEKKINDYLVSQGYDPENTSSADYIQKTDDCDWVF